MNVEILNNDSNFKNLSEASKRISSNKDSRFVWENVKTKAGCYIEFGGCKLSENEFNYKAYVFKKDSEGWSTYSNTNKNLQHNFSIEIELKEHDLGEIFCSIDLPQEHIPLHNKFKTVEKFLEFLDNTEDLNTRTIELDPVYKTVVSGYKLKNFF